MAGDHGLRRHHRDSAVCPGRLAGMGPTDATYVERSGRIFLLITATVSQSRGYAFDDFP